MSTIPPVDRGWKLGMLAVLAVGPFGLAACGDADDEEPVTQAAYDDEAARLCDTIGDGEPVVMAADALPTASSDADRVSFLLAELVPEARSIVRSLRTFGYPPEQRAVYSNATARALSAINRIESNAPAYVDLIQGGNLLPDEDPLVDLVAAYADLDVPC